MSGILRNDALGRACIIALAAVWFAPTGVRGEVVRNSLSGAKDYIGGFAWGSGGIWGRPGTIFTPSVSGKLGTFTVTVYGEDGSGFTDPDWEPYRYRIFVYDSVDDDYMINPRDGFSVDAIFNQPSNANYLDPVGSYDPGDGSGPFTKHNFAFDLSSSNIQVTAGNTYVIAFQALDGDGGFVHQSVSDVGPAGNPDIYASDAVPPTYVDDLLPDEPTDWFASKLTIIEAATCGNGVVEGGETCDDGFTDACGSCNATCTGAGTGSTCGDGVVCPETEVCHDGPSNGTGDGFCLSDCSAVQDCGNGVVEGTEACDDGNTIDVDLCTNACQINPNPIPAASTWGLVTLTLLVLTAGSLVLRRNPDKRHVAA